MSIFSLGRNLAIVTKKMAILIYTIATIEAMKIRYFTVLSVKVLKEHALTLNVLLI